MNGILLLIAMVFSSCTYQDGMKITYYTNCDDIEAELDLERSVNMLKNKLESNDIMVVHNQDSSFCGYRLKKGDKIKNFKGAMTDYDLALEIEEFFNLKILNQ